MTDLRTAAQQALEALEYHVEQTRPIWKTSEAITALRAALAQEQAEPVAWTLTKTLDKRETTTNGYLWFSDPVNSSWTPLYTAPLRCPNCASLEAQNDELDRKLAERERAAPVAVVGTQVDVWRGCDGRWAPPGEPIKTALMLTDMPVGTMLYTAPPQRQPLTEEEIDAEWHELDGEASALFKRVIRKFARAVERVHGIGAQS